MVFVLILGPEDISSASGTPEVKLKTSENSFSIFNYETPIIISVPSIKLKKDTKIRVSGFPANNRLELTPLDDPARLLIDMFIAVPNFKTVTLPLNTPAVMALRVGHHPEKVRLVLEIQGPLIPETRTIYESDGFVLVVNTPGRDGDTMNEKSDDFSPDTSGRNRNAGNAESGASPDNFVGSAPFPTNLNSRRSFRRELKREEQENPLLHVPVSDLGPDAALFAGGIDHYYYNEWSAAISQLEILIGKYPDSFYAQKAQFLMPILYEKRYADSLPVHFRELTERYRDAVSRFPDSPFTGDAMLRMGKLYYQMKNYAEAQGYYNLAMKSSPPDSSVALDAKLCTAVIFRLKGREQEAEALLQSVIDSTTDFYLKSQAMMEFAKILYDQNAFQNSLDVLFSLMEMDGDATFRLPELALYMGNNYFQLEHNTLAREQLFQYYNGSPDSEENHLLLARIGDTYLRDGRILDAVKFFLFVCKRYPATRGANISWIRLAEQQEVSPEVDSLIPLSSRQIYEKVHGFFMEKDESDPLAKLALLKLGVLYQKEKAYEQSLKSLKKLFSYKPQGALRENGTYALQKTLDSMLTTERDNGNPGKIIAIYEQEKELIHQLFLSEPIYLVVARAYLDLGLKEKGLVEFQRMDGLLPDTEKPEDLLYFVGHQAYWDQEMDKARERLALLVKNYPGGKYAGEATLVMAEIFFKQKAYDKAMDLFNAALKYDLSRCRRTKLLVHLAEAALKTNERKRAMAAVREAEKNHGSCDDVSGYLGDEIGDLFLNWVKRIKPWLFLTAWWIWKRPRWKKPPLNIRLLTAWNAWGRTRKALPIMKK